MKLGYLIVNREIVSEDIEDFEYTPKKEFEGIFTIYNEPNEEQLLKKWFEHLNELRPNVYVTYNGDFFDWPFIETRTEIRGLDMKEEIGVYMNNNNVYECRFSVHIDCYQWVQRDSYLP